MSFQQGNLPTAAYAGCKDSYLESVAATTNRGAVDPLIVDGTSDRAGIIKWDISFIPTNAVVTAVSMTLNVTNHCGGNTYETYEVLKEWSEGTNAAGTGVTWNTINGGVNWATGGCQGAADRNNTNLCTVSVNATGSTTFNFNASGVAVVQQWITSPSSNHGILIFDFGVGNDLQFSSRNNGTAANRPRLNVTYSTVNRYWIRSTAGTWSNAAHWSDVSGGAAAGGIPGAANVAIFDGGTSGALDGNCDLPNSVDIVVGGVVLTSAYSGTVAVNSDTITIGTTGLSIDGGTVSGGAVGPHQVNGPFVQTAGTFTGGVAWNFAENFTRAAGTFTAAGAITFNGPAQAISPNGATFSTVNFAGTSTKTLTTNATFTTSTVSSTLVLGNGLTLTSSGASTLTVTGTMELQENSTLDLANNAAVNVNAGGTFRIRASSGLAASTAGTVKSTSSGVNKWAMSVANTATLSARGGRFLDGIITTAAAPTNVTFGDCVFSALPSGGANAFLDLSLMASGYLELRSLDFYRGTAVAASTARNVKASVATLVTTVGGYGGDLGGEIFDNDSSNRIRWVNNRATMEINGNPSNWLSASWLYRKKITVNNSTNTATHTNYPVLVTTDTATPVAAGKMNAAGDDIRFTAADGTTTLDYWIESGINTATTLIWVEVLSIPGSSTATVYMYYGNGAAAAASNGDNVFTFFDDFTGATLDATKWAARAGASVAVNQTIGGKTGIRITAGDVSTPSTVASSPVGLLYEARLRWMANTGGQYAGIMMGESKTTTGSNTAAKALSYYMIESANPTNNVTSWVADSTTASYNISSGQLRFVQTTGTDYILGIHYTPAGQIKYYQDRAINNTWTGTWDRPYFLWLGQFNSGGSVAIKDTFYDYAIVRKFSDPHPSTVLDIETEWQSARTLEEALEGLGGGTLSVTTTYTDSGSNIHRGFTYSGPLTIPASFTGTLNLDGVTFVTQPGSAIVIDRSATVAGTINLRNCMMVDPSDTSAAGRVMISGAGACAVNAIMCTVDTNSMASAGLTSATNCVFARSLASYNVASPSAAAPFLAYDERNLRLTKAGKTAVGATSAVPAGFEKDIDGKDRSKDPLWPALTNIPRGCSYYGPDDTAATVTVQTDVTAGLAATPSAVLFTSPPLFNSGGSCFYLAGADGTNCYMSLVGRFDGDILDCESWAGARAAWPSFVESSTAGDFWVFVPYDSDGDGTYDNVRRLYHDGNSFTSSTNINTLRNSAGTALNFTSSSGGWNGSLFVQSSIVTGTTEYQVAMPLSVSNGQIHVWFIDPATGNFCGANGAGAPDYTDTASAADSYTSGGYTINPNVYAPPMIVGSLAGGGSIYVTRTVNGSAQAFVDIDRVSPSGGAVNAVTNFLTGPVAGTSYSTDPLLHFVVTGVGNRRTLLYNGDDKVTQFHAGTLVGVTKDLGLGSSTYAAPSGVYPAGQFQSGVLFLPFYNAATGLGAVVAVEYDYTQDGDTNLEILDGTYVFPAPHAARNVNYDGAGNSGDFLNGIAPVVGQPTMLVHSTSPKTVFCATDAGMLYAWRANARWTTEDATVRGVLLNHFPINVPGGRITAITRMNVGTAGANSAAIQTAIGVAANAVIMGIFTDSGQIMFMRIP